MSTRYPNLLVIEDDQKALQVLKQMLDGQFRLRTALSLQEGLDALANTGIDAILLDLTLPDSSGLETFNKILDAARKVPIVVFTGHSDEDLAVKAVQQGAQDYLIKGEVSSHLLARSLRYAMERARTQADLQEAHDNLEHRVAERTQELSNANNQLENALEQIARSQEVAARRERLHALGNMASGIAHDFNNCLAPIVGYLDLLLKNPETLKDTERVQGYLESMQTAAMSAGQVSRRLREFYRERPDTDHHEPFDLNHVITETVNDTKPKWSDIALGNGVNINISTNLEKLPPILGSASELQEVITSLVFNAVEALEHDGTITIRTRLHQNLAVMEVVDNGCGMPSEVRKRCFDPFFTTKGRNATGFGLSTIYGIIEHHHGEIDVESTEGQGTTFRVKLPITQDGIVKAEAPQSTPTCLDEPGPPLKILIVDDEPLLREVIDACLTSDGHTVKVTSTGAEALAAFSDEGGFDLVITDRAMPEMNGDQLALEIKKLDPSMYVILLTGFGDLMTVAGERPADVDDIVSKPFSIESLRQALVRYQIAARTE